MLVVVLHVLYFHHFFLNVGPEQLFIDFTKACDSVRMECGITTKGVRLIKVCINETYSRVQVA